MSKKTSPTNNTAGTVIVLVIFGIFVISGVVHHNRRQQELKKFMPTPTQSAEMKQREKDIIASHEAEQREIEEAQHIPPNIGRHLCDNKDGHYRGVVASEHKVSKDLHNQYTAYKLTNGQVVAEAIIRVCTPREQKQGEAR